jgi:hypothetical protein
MQTISAETAGKKKRAPRGKPEYRVGLAKFPVSSSHLALRFYKVAGWTKEILDEYLIKGRVVDIWPGQKVRDYWWLDHEKGSQLDMDRLYNERVSAVHRFDEKAETHLTDLEYMKRMNW